MAQHTFGGDWTEDKLGRVHEYLTAYRKIFEKNRNARYYATWYVDAFAGTGSRARRDTSCSTETLFEDVYRDADTSAYQDGSARKALGLDSPFDNYLFIDESKTHVNELDKSITRDFPRLRDQCKLKQGDANELLKRWCSERNWQKERAVVFLDPYGMQVEWATIEVLAATKAVDLWYLFPLGMGVARLLKRDGKINQRWEACLTKVFGTADWRNHFYQVQASPSLFGDQETTERNASAGRIKQFIEERLRSCFVGVANGKVLMNSKSFPLYLLCFAAANKVGALPALKIANYILRD